LKVGSSSVVSVTLPVARKLAALGIRAVTIAPGIFETSMLAALPEVPTSDRFVAPSLKLSYAFCGIPSNRTRRREEDRSERLFKVADRQTVASLPSMLETSVIGREGAVVTGRAWTFREGVGDAGL
jgi:NAD(P)-dependent dehydrogenase (short-subunit alcohol dehydrogenase family)